MTRPDVSRDVTATIKFNDDQWQALWGTRDGRISVTAPTMLGLLAEMIAVTGEAQGRALQKAESKEGKRAEAKREAAKAIFRADAMWKLANCGMTQDEIGAAFGVDRSRVSQIMRRHDPLWAGRFNLDTPLNQLPISVRAANGLMNIGCKTLRCALGRTDAEILRVPNLGKKSLGEIKKAILTAKARDAVVSEDGPAIQIPASDR